MSTLAQEEADRLFSQKEHTTSHPEDQFEHERSSLRSSNSSEEQNNADPYEISEKDDDDEDTLHNMTTTTTTATYRLPTTRFEANTGPKGVIADAQSFNRAKKYSFRGTLATLTNNAFSHTSQQRKTSDSNMSNSLGEKSDSELGGSDDEDFMRQWRENRFQELANKESASQRRSSPSKRVWGTFDKVDANGYLDAVEKVPEDTVVVVCIYDPESNDSAAVEDSLATIAQKHVTTHFVKMHYDIAEMEHITVPAILAYRAGDVFATLDGCRLKGLETTLRRNGIVG